MDAAREAMVRAQIERRGISDPALLRALRETPRHLFVPSERRGLSYFDCALGLTEGQTISQPYMVALMSEILGPLPTDNVLEIGTGSGYQTAILSQLCGHVYSVEIIPSLARSARDLLRRLGYADNVSIREGDGHSGWPDHAPYARILVTAAPPELPPALIEQLDFGGRLVAPVGTANQRLVIVEKEKNGNVRRRSASSVEFVPMVKGRQPQSDPRQATGE